jgi:hypothetical protein
MPVRASVLPQPTPGHAILRVSELDVPPEGLTLSIQRQQGPDSHLAEEGWRRTETWLQPDQVVRVRGVLDFHLGPAICDQLAGIATVRLRVKEPDVGIVAATVVAWPAMLTSGAIDPARQAEDESPFRFRRPPLQVAEPPAPPFEPEPAPEPPRPIPELRAARDLMPEPEPSGWKGWLIAAMVVILAAGGAGYYAYRTYFQHDGTVLATATPTTAAESQTTPTPVQPKPGEPPKKSVRDTVAEYLATKPTPEAMLAKGREYAQAGEVAAAFLVWRRAAEAGNVQAELEIAAYYDPLSPRPKTGFAPDGQRAADWYERAALAGNAEAQRKLGLLLAMGTTGMPADPAKARSWLQQAAAQNDADAKKALEQLGK